MQIIKANRTPAVPNLAVDCTPCLPVAGGSSPRPQRAAADLTRPRPVLNNRRGVTYLSVVFRPMSESSGGPASPPSLPLPTVSLFSTSSGILPLPKWPTTHDTLVTPPGSQV
ncbi:hypothetical protein EVAR_14123_1 [Eumeta japonica]|uniref:Uncharacterized protein n=1 Tax=Eumeta variegata TaxID=151549 RepID=A0A4C1UNZ2_EUMVA|nr:hypothetical protein EVAR_14123_1 [Eumeta japonica]